MPVVTRGWSPQLVNTYDQGSRSAYRFPPLVPQPNNWWGFNRRLALYSSRHTAAGGLKFVTSVPISTIEEDLRPSPAVPFTYLLDTGQRYKISFKMPNWSSGHERSLMDMEPWLYVYVWSGFIITVAASIDPYSIYYIWYLTRNKWIMRQLTIRRRLAMVGNNAVQGQCSRRFVGIIKWSRS